MAKGSVYVAGDTLEESWFFVYTTVDPTNPWHQELLERGLRLALRFGLTPVSEFNDHEEVDAFLEEARVLVDECQKAGILMRGLNE